MLVRPYPNPTILYALCHQGLYGQLPCECLLTYSLALTVKTDTAVDLLLWFVPSPFINVFFSLHGYCLHFCNVELNLITKGKDLNAHALLGKDHGGKPFSTPGSHVPHQRLHQPYGAHGCFPLTLAKV